MGQQQHRPPVRGNIVLGRCRPARPDVGATYDVTAGVLNLTISERLGGYDSTKIVLHDSAKLNNVTFSANDFAQHKHGYLNVTLNSTQRASFESLNHPRSVAILPNGMTDLWGNQNPAALTLALSYADTVPPAITSATYDIASGTLSVSLSEPVLAPDTSKIRLGDASSEMAVSSVSHSNDTLTIPLDSTERMAFASLAAPRNITIMDNGISGIWNNQNPANITHTISHTGDTAPPTITSAVYNTTSHALNVTFSERVSMPVTVHLHSYGTEVPVTLAKHDASTASASVTLTGSTLTIFEHLRLPRSAQVWGPGNAVDLWGNANTADIAQTITYVGDGTSPALSPRPVLCRIPHGHRPYSTSPYPRGWAATTLPG